MDLKTDDQFDGHVFPQGEHWKIDTKKHLVRYDPGGEILVVSFDPYGWVKDWSDPENPPASWGSAFLSRQGYSILGVLSKRSVWFREDALFDAFDSLRQAGFFARFRRVVFYGASKGGYGALAFSSYAPGSNVLAFAPQTTLHKPLVPFEIRKYPALGKWSGPVIDGAAEVASAASVQVIYDPHQRLDKLHIDRIKSDNVIHYKCSFWGHDLPVVLSAKGVLKTVVKQAIEGELTRAEFQKTVRSGRRPRRYYKYLVNKLIAQKKYAIALRLVEQRLVKKVDHKFFLLRKAVILSHQGEFEQMNKILWRFESGRES